MVLWAYQSVVQESTGCTSAALMFGWELRTPVDLAFGVLPAPNCLRGPGLSTCRTYDNAWPRHITLVSNIRQMQGDSRSGHTLLAAKDGPFQQERGCGSAVQPERNGVSPKLTSQRIGPREVQSSDVVYRVSCVSGGRTVFLHRDRLAPYRLLAEREGPADQTSPAHLVQHP